MTQLWQHQQRGIDAVLEKKTYGLFFDMGTGKTRTAIEAVKRAGCRRILVLAPLAVCPVWPSQLDRWAQGRWHCVTLDKGTVTARAKHIEGVLETAGDVAVVVNYDSAWRSELGTLLLKQKWDAVIADEAHRLKAHNSKVSKFAAKLAATYRLGLTGTPFGQNELDAFGLFRFINRDVFGTLWAAFRAKYAVMGGPNRQWIRGVQNVEELRQRIAPWCAEVRARDVLDLPAETDTVLPVALTPAAMQAYRDFEKDMIAQVGDDLMTASNALVKMLRLQQLAGGMAHGEDSSQRVCDAKLRALAELLDDVAPSEPVVVFGQFRADVEGAMHAAENAGREAYRLDGDEKETALWAEACAAGKGAVLCCQMRAGGLGVDLTAARICVYLSTGYSVADYLQSRARTMRAGQTRNVAYYHIRASGTIDEIVAAALSSKRDGVEATLEYLRRRGNERDSGTVQSPHVATA